jgi:uncharacterized membrane protein YjfL (UPF0719 family)
MEAQLATNLVAALAFAVLGIVILIASFWLLDRLTPYDLWREVVEKQNVAVAVLGGLALLGLAIIIAAAIH